MVTPLTGVVNMILGLIVLALPTAVGDLISDTVSGAVVVPFAAVVLTLVYFRLRTASGPTYLRLP